MEENIEEVHARHVEQEALGILTGEEVKLILLCNILLSLYKNI